MNKGHEIVREFAEASHKIYLGRTTINSTDTLKLYPVHRHWTSLCRDSLFNRIVIIWNNLPVHMRKSSSFISFKSRLNDYCFNKLLSTCDSDRPSTWKQGRRKGGGGRGGGGARPLALSQVGQGGQKCPFIKYTCLIKNEQALAEVIICVKAERGVTARSEILRLYLLQAW